MNVKVTCANCKCIGKLRKQNGKVIFVPSVKTLFHEEGEEKGKGFFARHGSSTVLQKINFVIWGTLFWITARLQIRKNAIKNAFWHQLFFFVFALFEALVTVMLIANFISLAKSKFKPGVGSYCVREYKKCISEFDWNLCASSMYDCGDMENENYGRFNFTAPQKIQDFLKVEQSLSVFSSAQNRANENICLFTAHISSNICENLCFSSDFSYDPDEEHKFYATEESSELRYNHEKNAECKSICMLASDLEVEEDCPFHNRCPNGCPCPGYKCLEDVLDFNLASVVFGKNDQKNISRSFYKISRKSETLKFDELAMNDELTNLGNFCVVTFRGHFFVIQAGLEAGVGNPSFKQKMGYGP